MNKYINTLLKGKFNLVILGLILAGAVSQMTTQSAIAQKENLTFSNNANFTNSSRNNGSSFNPSVKWEIGKVESVLSLPDDKTIVGGTFNEYDGTNRNQLAKLNADGTLDQTFIAETNGRVYTIVRQTDDKILIGGSFTQVNGIAINRLARLNADGTVDTTFNIGSGVSSLVFDIIVRDDEKILIGGAFNSINGISRRAIAQINSDGSLDTSFTPITNIVGIIYKIAVQTDGKVIIGINGGVTGSNNFGLARLNPDGNLDNTFRADTSVTNNVGDVFVKSIVLLESGKILVGGKFTAINSVPRDNIARLNADGSVDETFSASVTSSSIFTFVDNIKFQSDGKIVVGGFFSLPTNNIARFNADGLVDATFNVGSGTNDSIDTLVVKSDDKILIGGFFTKFNLITKGLFARLNSDGSLDSKFNDGAGFSNLRAGNVYTTATQTDGKILIAGEFTQINSTPKFSIARLNTDGSLDNTFDSGSGSFLTKNDSNRVLTIALQSDGKILIGGSFRVYNGTPVSNIVRLNNDGTLDNSFIGTVIGGDVNKIVIQTSGSILIGGDFNFVNGKFKQIIARLLPDGSLDSSFDFPVSSNGRISDILLQPDGKIVFSGNFQYSDPQTNTNRRTVARLNADGSFDNSFLVELNSSNSNTGESIECLPNGKMLVAGSRGIAAILRLNSNGSVDNTFNTIMSGNGDIKDSYTQTDGKTIVVGSFTVFQGVLSTYIARINDDGSLDSSWNTTTNDRVETIMPYGDNRVIIGGFFSNVGGIDQTSVAILSIESNMNKTKFDFDGDGKTDVSIFRPNVGEWWYLRSSDLGNRALQFGSSTDIPVPADFTGDGKTDIAFWRYGEWFVLRSEDDSFFSFPFGTSGDIPVSGDFDGDGKADPTVFRPSQGVWYVSKTTGGTDIIPFGIGEDKPVVADYDGDGKDDIAIYRPSNSQWWINRSQAGLTVVQFGQTGDKTVPGDYTGDGKADVAFFRPTSGEWFIIRSEDNSFFSFPFGTNGDIAAPGDYDGDGVFDSAVFRPSQTTWFLNTTSNGVQIVGFGANGDVPVPSVFSVP